MTIAITNDDEANADIANMEWSPSHVNNVCVGLVDVPATYYTSRGFPSAHGTKGGDDQAPVSTLIRGNTPILPHEAPH